MTSTGCLIIQNCVSAYYSIWPLAEVRWPLFFYLWLRVVLCFRSREQQVTARTTEEFGCWSGYGWIWGALLGESLCCSWRRFGRVGQLSRRTGWWRNGFSEPFWRGPINSGPGRTPCKPWVTSGCPGELGVSIKDRLLLPWAFRSIRPLTGSIIAKGF